VRRAEAPELAGAELISIEVDRIDRERRGEALVGLSHRLRRMSLSDDEVVICEACDGPQRVGLLVLAPDGLILALEVEPERQREGIATAMYRRVLADGYEPRHDWEHMTPEGAAWVASL